MLHGLEKFHHYCFAYEVHIITDNKPLVAIMGKDVATLLYIHWYRVCILYKSGPELFLADWLSCHSQEENNDRGIQGLSIKINVINTPVYLPVCTSIQIIQEARAIDVHL